MSCDRKNSLEIYSFSPQNTFNNRPLRTRYNLKFNFKISQGNSAGSARETDTPAVL